MDRRITGSRRGAVVKEVQLGYSALIVMGLVLDKNLTDKRRNGFDGIRDGEEPHERQPRVCQTSVNALTDRPDLGFSRQSA
jgi:hypothetical protein